MVTQVDSYDLGMDMFARIVLRNDGRYMVLVGMVMDGHDEIGHNYICDSLTTARTKLATLVPSF